MIDMLVLPNDLGIRPAGKPDHCFYCRRKVGEPHDLAKCPMIQREITYGIYLKVDGKRVARIGTWRTRDPSYYDKKQANFHKNESTWCVDNFLSDSGYTGEPPAPAADQCLCGHLDFDCEAIGDDLLRAEE